MVAHILIACRGVPGDCQGDQNPIAGYLLAFRPTDFGDNVAERIAKLALNHRRCPSDSTLIPAEDHSQGATPDTFNLKIKKIFVLTGPK